MLLITTMRVGSTPRVQIGRLFMSCTLATIMTKLRYYLSPADPP